MFVALIAAVYCRGCMTLEHSGALKYLFKAELAEH